jgi:Zn-dependent M32 family carboxypeptidase
MSDDELTPIEYHNKFTEELIKRSEANNFTNAKLEWYIELIEEGIGECICTHKLKLERVRIRNRINNKSEIIGACCAKRFKLAPEDEINKLVSKCHNKDIWCEICDKKKRYNKKLNTYNCKCDLIYRDLVKHEVKGEQEKLDFGKTPTRNYKTAFDNFQDFDEYLQKKLYKIKREHKKYITWSKKYKQLLNHYDAVQQAKKALNL